MGFPKGKKLRATFLWDAAGGAGADSSTLTGVIPILSLPANSVVHAVMADVKTLVAGSTAEEVGDGNDVDGWIVDNFAAATGIYPTSAEDATCGAYAKTTTAGATDAADVSRSATKKLYTVADTLDFKISGTATAGKIRFDIDFEVLY